MSGPEQQQQQTADFSDKKFLVIDDFPEFRSSVKKMVESFGGKTVEVAANGEEATEKMMKTKFDVVLSDYNLGGEGKDGQQVLEEAKFKKLLKTSTIYIMLTAESTIKMVMGALEYEPDGYLTKPFNKLMLMQRLEKIYDKKILMNEIYESIDRKQVDKAVKLCDVEIKNKSKVMIDCLKIKARLFVEHQKFDAAKKIYEQVLSVKRLPWAVMGIGKCLYFLGEHYDASNEFQSLIDENSMCVEAYDWLARCKEKMGDVEDAQKLLEEAVKLSPKAILRQQELAKYAKINKDYEIAEKALRNSVSLGKFSVYKNEDDSLNLAEVLVERIATDSGIKGKRAGNEALQVLKDVARTNPKDNNLAAKASLMEAQIHTGLKAPAEAKKSMQRAEAAFGKMGDKAPLDLSMKMATTFAQMGDNEKAIALATKIAVKHFEDENLKESIEAMCEEVGAHPEQLIAAEKEKMDNLNKAGKKLFEEGKLIEACELFEKALEENPENVGVTLNAVQAMIKYMETKGKDHKMLNRSRKYLDKVKDIAPEDKRYNRFQELCRLHSELSSKT